jgi:tetratricopeptide (TPR) repeat protein
MERRCIPLCLVFISIALPVISQSATGPVRLDPIAVIRGLADVDESLELETFIRTALVFSAVPENQLAGLEAQIRNHISELRGGLREVTEPRDQAEAALAYMHGQLLRRYDERQTGVDVLLERGSYNCVSSGVVYAILLKALGLRVWGVRTSDHAFCRVQAGEQAFDVETTSPFGFDPGTRKEFTDNFGHVTGYSYVPPSNYRDRRDIGEKELLGLILFNRAAFASERRDYLAAVPPAVDAYALLEDEESYERLITSLLNLASWYGMSGRFTEALEFLNRAGERYRNDRLDALQGDLTHNWVLGLIQKGNFAEAEQLLDTQRTGGCLEEGEWKELTVYLYQVQAKKSVPGDYGEAARLILEGLNKVGSDQGLTKSYEVYIHNSVVTLVRNELYDEALSVLEEALLQLPDSGVLLKDRSMVLEAVGRR